MSEFQNKLKNIAESEVKKWAVDNEGLYYHVLSVEFEELRNKEFDMFDTLVFFSQYYKEFYEKCKCGGDEFLYLAVTTQKKIHAVFKESY